MRLAGVGRWQSIDSLFVPSVRSPISVRPKGQALDPL